jgi:hypothetical protein
VIRFLAPPEGEDVPYVRLWHHFFKGPTGKYYVQNNLNTIGKKDPVTDANAILYALGRADLKKTLDDRKRKLTYISNILVVKDPANPQNDGKVFLFKYGAEIFNKITSAMKPEPVEGDDEIPESVDVFNLWEGANLKLILKREKKRSTYINSEWKDPSPVAETDEEIESIWKQCKSLQAFIAPDQFKSYDELKALYEAVVGPSSIADVEEPEEETDDEEEAPKPAPKAKAKAKPAPKAPPVEEEDDADTAFFAGLADED